MFCSILHNMLIKKWKNTILLDDWTLLLVQWEYLDGSWGIHFNMCILEIVMAGCSMMGM